MKLQSLLTGTQWGSGHVGTEVQEGGRKKEFERYGERT